MIKHPTHNLTLLNIYLYFRLALGLLLFTLHFTSETHDVLGAEDPKLFRFWILLYVAVCVGTAVFLPAKKLLYSFNRLVTLLCFDLCSMLVLIHTSGGIESGLGYLLLIFVAMGSIFIRGHRGLIFAAIASLLVLAESFYQNIDRGDSAVNSSIFSSGILGILLFINALVFQFFTRKIQQSTQEAEKHAEYAKHLQRLAQSIITRMRTGVIVVDNAGHIELINESALQLLNLPSQIKYADKSLADISSLMPVFEQWLKDPNHVGPNIYRTEEGIDLRISLASLELSTNERTVLYLEDHRALTQQAQSLKLASLGRLAASIAHEIRNPLGAISHASQLLNESDKIHESDSRLVEIILQHAHRVNRIIEDTLVLSRRKERHASVITLDDWLPVFVNEFKIGKTAEIVLNIEKSNLKVRFDPTQLNQILTNLCDNGARYSFAETGKEVVYMRAALNENKDTAFIEIEDEGPGVPENQRNEIFDPFFTTEEKGSGLGLFICNELCEINQASISYKKPENERSCFRIDFSHYKRMS